MWSYRYVNFFIFQRYSKSKLVLEYIDFDRTQLAQMSESQLIDDFF